jgi:exodeoxyribonuclease VIII
METKNARWLPEITDDEYNAIPALRATELKVFARSAAHFKAYQLKKREETESLRMGKLIHLRCLQPDVYKKHMVISPKFDRRTKDGKMAAAEFEAKLTPETIIVTEDEDKKLRDIRASFWEYLKHKRDIWDSITHVERAGVATVRGVPCKIKPDMFRFDESLLLQQMWDLKSTQDASESAFIRSIYNFGYHLQAAFYAVVAEEITGFAFDKFTFLAIETEAPYAIREFELSETAMHHAKSVVYQKLEYFACCQAMDLWEAYPA